MKYITIPFVKLLSILYRTLIIIICSITSVLTILLISLGQIIWNLSIDDLIISKFSFSNLKKLKDIESLIYGSDEVLYSSIINYILNNPIDDYNLFLDDERDLINHHNYLHSHHNGFNNLYDDVDWVIVCSYIEFKAVIEKRGLPSRISFDHDLGIKLERVLPTGMDCCKWLVNYCLDRDIELTTECKYHTANPVGEKNMETYINNFKKLNDE